MMDKVARNKARHSRAQTRKRLAKLPWTQAEESVKYGGRLRYG